MIHILLEGSQGTQKNTHTHRRVLYVKSSANKVNVDNQQTFSARI